MWKQHPFKSIAFKMINVFTGVKVYCCSWDLLRCRHDCSFYKNSIVCVLRSWTLLRPHQAALAPGAPVAQHAVIGAGQPAFPGPQRHLLWVTEVVLHSLRGPIYSVEHAPLGFVMKHWIQELERDFPELQNLKFSQRAHFKKKIVEYIEISFYISQWNIKISALSVMFVSPKRINSSVLPDFPHLNAFTTVLF